MKKLKFCLFISLIIGLNVYVIHKSEICVQEKSDLYINIAYADMPASFPCASVMYFHEGFRTLECNSPCCYRMDYTPELTGGTCAGQFGNC